MLAIIATLTVKESAARQVEEALAVAAPIIRSDAEPGCHYYQPTRLKGDPNVFKVFEIYTDEAAFAAHRETEHFQPLKAIFQDALAKPPKVELLDVLG